MKIIFRGTRGSCPTFGIQDKSFISEKTPCIEIINEENSNTHFIIDAGLGITQIGTFGKNYEDTSWHIFLSHFHLDHIHGINFFAPMFSKGANIFIHSVNEFGSLLKDSYLRPEFFPISLEQFPANISFVRHNENEIFYPEKNIDMSFSFQKQNHPASSFAINVISENKKLTYASDCELQTNDDMQKAASFAKNADILIFDGSYTQNEIITNKKGWGHSSNIDGAILANLANAKNLFFTHHDPFKTPQKLNLMLEEAKEIIDEDKNVFLAQDNLVFEI